MKQQTQTMHAPTIIPQQILSIPGLIDIRNLLLFSLLSQISFNQANQILSQDSFQKQPQPFLSEFKVEDVPNQGFKAQFFSIQKAQKPQKLGKKNLRQKKKGKVLSKNDTKNIPKNYGKAILSFILESPATNRLAASMNCNLSDFLISVKKMKSKINSIRGLKRMWGSDNLGSKSKKCIRILSYEFMRKRCLHYIFHSKVKNLGTHIRHRQKLIEGIENPQFFTHIKQY